MSFSTSRYFALFLFTIVLQMTIFIAFLQMLVFMAVFQLVALCGYLRVDYFCGCMPARFYGFFMAIIFDSSLLIVLLFMAFSSSLFL